MHTCRGNLRKITAYNTKISFGTICKKKAIIKPDVSLRLGAIPVFPTSINSPSYQKLKANIVQIFLFIRSSYLR